MPRGVICIAGCFSQTFGALEPAGASQGLGITALRHRLFRSYGYAAFTPLTTASRFDVARATAAVHPSRPSIGARQPSRIAGLQGCLLGSCRCAATARRAVAGAPQEALASRRGRITSYGYAACTPFAMASRFDVARATAAVQSSRPFIGALRPSRIAGLQGRLSPARGRAAAAPRAAAGGFVVARARVAFPPSRQPVGARQRSRMAGVQGRLLGWDRCIGSARSATAAGFVVARATVTARSVVVVLSPLQPVGTRPCSRIAAVQRCVLGSGRGAATARAAARGFVVAGHPGLAPQLG